MNLGHLATVAALASAALLGLTACSGAAIADSGSGAGAADATGFAVNSETLVFGVVPDSLDTETNYRPLMDYIEQETGKTVDYHESTDYAALIEAAVAGKVDIASFSGFTYITATNKGADLIPISSIVTEEGQQPGYFSQAIVPASSSVESLEEFKGLKVCFVDPSSTSGYLFPSYNLLELGITPETDITPVFAGKHDVSVQKVGEGVECEAGFAEDSEVEKSDRVKVIDEVMVPGSPIVMSGALPAELQTQLGEMLSELNINQIIDSGVTSADSDAFRSVFFETEPVDDAYYDFIRDICKKTNAKQCQT